MVDPGCGADDASDFHRYRIVEYSAWGGALAGAALAPLPQLCSTTSPLLGGKYLGGTGAEVDIWESVPPFKILVRFYFRYILYTKMATGFALLFKDALFCSKFYDARKY